MSKINKIKINNETYDIQDLTVGNLEELSTEDKSNLVNAINEVSNNSGGISLEEVTNITGKLENLETTDKTNLVTAINEVFSSIGSASGGGDAGSCKVKELTTTPVELTTLEPGIYQNTTDNWVEIRVRNNVVTTISVTGGGQLFCFNGGSNYGCFATKISNYSNTGGLTFDALWANAVNGPFKGSYGFSNFVKISGNETINGTKTFNTLPQSSKTPSNSKDLVTKSYVDSAIAALKNELSGS